MLATLVLAGLVGACSDAPATERARVVPAVPEAAATVDDGAVLRVDTVRSLVRWRGTKVGAGRHEGIVRLAAGHVVHDESGVTGGDFTVDMRTIAITDIPPHEVEARRQLRSHLAHEEFFAVDRFPTARFVLTDVSGGEHGVYTVSGNLAVRDSVHNVTFEATAPVVSARAVWATARFSIDRNLWGVEFDGATSSLRNAIVHDDIQLEVTLVADAEVGGCAALGAGA